LILSQPGQEDDLPLKKRTQSEV